MISFSLNISCFLKLVIFYKKNWSSNNSVPSPRSVKTDRPPGSLSSPQPTTPRCLQLAVAGAPCGRKEDGLQLASVALRSRGRRSRGAGGQKTAATVACSPAAAAVTCSPAAAAVAGADAREEGGRPAGRGGAPRHSWGLVRRVLQFSEDSVMVVCFVLEGYGKFRVLLFCNM